MSKEKRKLEYKLKCKLKEWRTGIIVESNRPLKLLSFLEHQPCLPNPCENGAKCVADVSDSHGYHCECTGSWTGMLCEGLLITENF